MEGSSSPKRRRGKCRAVLALRLGAMPSRYPYRPARWQSVHSPPMLSFTSDMQRAQVRPGPVSHPWAWPTKHAPWRRGLSGVLLRKLVPATSYVLPLPEGADVEALKADIKGGRGKLHIVDTTVAAWGDGTAAAPRADWKSNRLGADPPDSLGKLRGDVRGDVLAAFGVPNLVFGSGGSAREAYRQFLASTITPIAKIVVEELAVKLDTPTLALDFTELRAADIASRARAYGVLINAGMPPAEAAEATGLD